MSGHKTWTVKIRDDKMSTSDSAEDETWGPQELNNVLSSGLEAWSASDTTFAQIL